MKPKKDLIKIGGIVGTALTVIGGVLAGAAELASKVKKETNK